MYGISHHLVFFLLLCKTVELYGIFSSQMLKIKQIPMYVAVDFEVLSYFQITVLYIYIR